MLSEKNQLDYNHLHFDILQSEFNLAMMNLASMQTELIKDIPEDVRQISAMTDSLSNIVIISGNCYFFKHGKDFKVIENNNVYFDKNLNIIKLKPTLSYKLEPKQGKARLITENSLRLFNKEKTSLRTLDDLLIKKETLSISTEEQQYQYTLNLEFQELQNFNNLILRLNDETLSYPRISEIYYVDTKRHKKNLKIFNNNAYSFDIDLNKNESNTYSLDFDLVEADNIYIVFEDAGLDLIIDSLEINFTEYSKEGHIVFEALEEEFPILKVGIEGQSSEDSVEFQVSHDNENWYNIDLSNTYNLENSDKIVSWNSVSPNTINTDLDVRSVYLKVVLRAIEKTIELNPRVNREIYSSGSFNTTTDLDSYSIYELSTANHYGERSLTHHFDFKDLYDRGEYLVINNNYYIKGFKETYLSKVNKSSYSFAPTYLQTKELRVSSKTLDLPNVDISSKVLYAFSLENITKNLLDLSGLECVIPLAPGAYSSIYYLKQGDNLISIDLSCGYINSALEVLFVVEDDLPVYLLDSFKNLVEDLTTSKKVIDYDIDGNFITVVSLLDSSLFEGVEEYSRTYPLKNLTNTEIGLLDNKLESLYKDREVPITHLRKTLLYTKDSISNKNDNYTTIVSDEDYERSKQSKADTIPSTTKAFKFRDAGIVKGSLILEEI